MTALIVIACIVVPLGYLLTRKVKLIAKYKDSPDVYAGLLFFKYHIYPKKEDGKGKKPSKSKKSKAVQPDEAALGDDKGGGIRAVLELVAGIIKAIYERTLKYIKLRLVRVRISVGTDDAAYTALLYGIIAQSAAYLIDMLDRITNVYPKDISVNADFTSGKINADIYIELSVRVWQVLYLAILAAMEYIKITGGKNEKKDSDAAKKTI